MRTLYLECNMGAAGDMLTAALAELTDAEDFIKRVNDAGIPDVIVTAEKTQKCGVTGTHIRVTVHGEEENEHMHEHHHHHSGIADVEGIIRSLNVSDAVKDNAIAVYNLIAEAESCVHNTDMEHIHFHEVGTMDAIADVVGVCMLMEELSPEKVVCSPVNVGGGTVKCAHGVLPVPAPATARILRDIPIYGSGNTELCTPTGAALLRHFVTEFAPMPAMKIKSVGYGMGSKDFETANCVRAFLGDSGDEGEVRELRCNIDDMTGEQIGFAVETLAENGALDVFTVPVYMKKNRPGILLTCLCKAEDRDKMVELIFRHTSTIGMREYAVKRHTLEREAVTVNTSHGAVRAKKSTGYGVTRTKPEYEDMANIARENNISVSDIKIKD